MELDEHYRKWIQCLKEPLEREIQSKDVACCTPFRITVFWNNLKVYFFF